MESWNGSKSRAQESQLFPGRKGGEFPGMDGAPGAGQKPKPIVPMDEPKDTELVMGSRMGSRVPVIVFPEEKTPFPCHFSREEDEGGG